MPASDIIYINGDVLATLLEDVPATIDFDEEGIAGAQLNYTVLWEFAPALVSVLKEHPDYSWLIRKKARVTREEACLAKVSVDFEGIPPTEEEEEGEGPTPTETDYSLDGSTSSDPIETNKNFPTFAGTWDNPLNGAVFVPANSEEPISATNYKFKEFAVVEPQPAHPKTGVTTYETFGVVYTETRTFAEANLVSIALGLNQLGKISTPPPSNYLPPVEAPRNWLLNSAKITRIGVGMKVSRSWKLSGPNGWDPDIYAAAP